MADFFKEFTIMDAINNLKLAWDQVTAKNMRGVWQPLLQRPDQQVHVPPVEEIVEDIVKLGHEFSIGFEKEDIIKEDLEWDDKDISDEDLLEIEQARAYEEEQEKEDDVMKDPSKMTSKELGMILNKVNELCDLIKEMDPNLERQFKVQKEIKEVVKCYKEESDQNAKKRKQNSIENFFSKKPTLE